jgi:RecJ-like exonuclease
VGKRHSLLHRLTASPEHLDAAELEEFVEERACCPVRDVQQGEFRQVVGRIRSVVYTPSETVPTLEAKLYDGTDTIDLVWLGRRRIAGIEPGRRVVVRGRVGEHDGRLAIYNPWYELLPVAVEASSRG